MEAREIEVKLAAGRPVLLKSRLRSVGAILVRRRHFEDNLIFDFPDRKFQRRGSLLRVRLTPGEATLTYKGPSRIVARTKSRSELETQVGDARTIVRILERMGLRCRFRYQKFRTVYRLGRALITLDETPIGAYLEIEGTPQSIQSVASRIGFQRHSFITATYLDLFLKYKTKNRFRNRNMVFDMKAQA